MLNLYTINLSINEKSRSNQPISEKTGIPKVDVLVTLETMFKEVKNLLEKAKNLYPWLWKLYHKKTCSKNRPKY